MCYNFARPHQTLTKRNGKPTMPAMAAAITVYQRSYTRIAQHLDRGAPMLWPTKRANRLCSYVRGGFRDRPNQLLAASISPACR